MRLSDDQVNNLIALLTPKFEDIEVRRAALEEVFPDESQALDLSGYEEVSSKEFTASLIEELASKQVRLPSGDLALTQLLTVLQTANKTKDRLFSANVQAYINLLRLSPPPDEKAQSGGVQVLDRRSGQDGNQPGNVISVASRQGGYATALFWCRRCCSWHRGSTARQCGARIVKKRRRRRSTFKRVFKNVSRNIRLPLILVILLTIVTIPTISTMVLTADARARVFESYDSVKRVVNSLNGKSIADLSQPDITRLQISVDDLVNNLNRAKNQTTVLRGLIPFRPDVKVYLGALDVGREIAAASKDVIEGLRPTLFYLIEGEKSKGATQTPINPGERIVELLRIGQARFASADGHLAASKEILDNLDLATAPASLLAIVQELVRFQGQIESINKILIESPDLLTQAFGIDRPMDYLILSQNSDEIRPSGGYISTYGWMRIRRVRIQDYGYGPTTSVSPNPPPDTLISEFKYPDWWQTFMQYKSPLSLAWDGSWTPDFPTTAKMAAWYYDKGNNPRTPVGGVIAIDIVGFEYLLAGLGDISVPGYDEIVNKDNFRKVIYKIRAGTEGDSGHKAYLAALYKEILATWQSSGQNGDAFVNAALRAMREKHIMLYFKDEKLNEVVRLLGWDGAQYPARENDYLQLVDTNMGNKSNRSIVRQLTYDVEIQPDGSLKCRATVAYDYSADLAQQDPGVSPANYNDINYYNVLQMFVPQGSTLNDSKNLPAKVDTAQNDGHTIFVTPTRVDFDTTERYQFFYSTPPVVEQYGPYLRYRLLIQKQPGMIDEAATIQITMPGNARIISTSPRPAANYSLAQPVLDFRVSLTTDQWIEIIYTK